MGKVVVGIKFSVNSGKEYIYYEKKSMVALLLTVSLSILLLGCGLGEENVDSSVPDSFDETQKIEVIASGSSDIITTISDDDDIEKFVYALKMDDWNLVDIPSGATKGKQFKMYQMDTIKKGEPMKKKDLNEVATMTSFEDVPFIEFNLKSISFHFKVPEEVHKYLNSVQ